MKAWKLFLLLCGVALAGVVFYGMRLLRHGLSTAGEPSYLETVVARTARNLAIPRKARLETNPFEATPEILHEARESFVDRCAVCHGQDGSGQSQDGRNLYPRAPDLRLPQTQNLTDGEIRYIIRNGVRLTGMPGWAKPHDEQSDDSWKLVLFIRSLRVLSKQEQQQQAPGQPARQGQGFGHGVSSSLESMAVVSRESDRPVSRGNPEANGKTLTRNSPGWPAIAGWWMLRANDQSA